ncbi:MAG TPA: hypothetical protein VGF79_11530 [Bacteroidia bacterium]
MFSIISCKRDCHETGTCDPEYYRFELGEAKDYLWAGKGSYWIYKNSKTGDLDTQICTSAKTYWIKKQGSTNYSKNITVEYEVLSRNISSSFNDWAYIDETSFYNPDALRSKKTELERTAIGEGINRPFLHPFVLKDKSGTSSSVTTCIHTDTSITIQGKTYDHVAVFEIDMDEIWEEKLNCIRPNSVYWWAKGVGLIRRDMKRCDYSWELIEYNIIL